MNAPTPTPSLSLCSPSSTCVCFPSVHTQRSLMASVPLPSYDCTADLHPHNPPTTSPPSWAKKGPTGNRRRVRTVPIPYTSHTFHHHCHVIGGRTDPPPPTPPPHTQKNMRAVHCVCPFKTLWLKSQKNLLNIPVDIKLLLHLIWCENVVPIYSSANVVTAGNILVLNCPKIIKRHVSTRDKCWGKMSPAAHSMLTSESCNNGLFTTGFLHFSRMYVLFPSMSSKLY